MPLSWRLIIIETYAHLTFMNVRVFELKITEEILKEISDYENKAISRVTLETKKNCTPLTLCVYKIELLNFCRIAYRRTHRMYRKQCIITLSFTSNNILQKSANTHVIYEHVSTKLR